RKEQEVADLDDDVLADRIDCETAGGDVVLELAAPPRQTIDKSTLTSAWNLMLFLQTRLDSPS
ncbi:MAG: hypothetical protein HYZ43_09910, partial [Flavobacteriia bacterium]|nr:hypothetical protein [Flavobacteriia bacterium]